MTGGAGGKWMLFKEAKEAQLGGGDKPDYLTVLATVIHIRSNNCTYKACPTENCNKKVVLCVFSGKYYKSSWMLPFSHMTQCTVGQSTNLEKVCLEFEY